MSSKGENKNKDKEKSGRQFEFVASSTACDDCRKLDGEIFYESEKEKLPPYTHTSWKGVPNCTCTPRWIDDKEEDDGGIKIADLDAAELTEEEVVNVDKFFTDVKERKKKIDKRDEFLKKVKLGEERKTDTIKRKVKKLYDAGASLGEINRLLQTADLQKVSIDSDLPFSDEDKAVIEKINQPFFVTLDEEGELKLSRDLTEITAKEKRKYEESVMDVTDPSIEGKTRLDLKKIIGEKRDIEAQENRLRDFLTRKDLEEKSSYKVAEVEQRNRQSLLAEEWIMRYSERNRNISEDATGIRNAYRRREREREQKIQKDRLKREVPSVMEQKEKDDAWEVIEAEVQAWKDEKERVDLIKHRQRRAEVEAFNKKAKARGDILRRFRDREQEDQARELLDELEKPNEEFGKGRGRDEDKDQYSIFDDKEIEQFKLSLFKELKDYADNLKITMESYFQDEIDEYIEEQASEMGIFSDRGEDKEKKPFRSSIDEFVGTDDTDDTRTQEDFERDIERFQIETYSTPQSEKDDNSDDDTSQETTHRRESSSDLTKKELLTNTAFLQAISQQVARLYKEDRLQAKRDAEEFGEDYNDLTAMFNIGQEREDAEEDERDEYDTSLQGESGEEVLPPETDMFMEEAELQQAQARISELTKSNTRANAEIQSLKDDIRALQEQVQELLKLNGKYQ